MDFVRQLEALMNRPRLLVALATAALVGAIAAGSLLAGAAPQAAKPQARPQLSRPAPEPARTLPAAQAVPQSMAQVQLTFAPVVRRVAPAVVNVYARAVVQTPMNPFFNDPMFQRFF